jgi:phage terminase large subunit-like protein
MTTLTPYTDRNADYYTAMVWDYAEAVANKTLPAPRFVRLAVKRFLTDFDKSLNDPTYKYYYDPLKTYKICKFVDAMVLLEGFEGPFVLEPWQAFILAQFGWVHRLGEKKGFRRFRRFWIECPRGNGKALSLDTPIPTPSGWTTMGQIQAKDWVFSDDGNPVQVLAVTDIMNDHKCFEVTFDDGSTIIADANHLWQTKAVKEPERTHRTSGRKTTTKTTIKTTQEIADTLMSTYPGGHTQVNHRIENTRPLYLPEADLPIHPYLLGYWLGDGSSAGAGLTIGEEDQTAVINIMKDIGVELYPTNWSKLQFRLDPYVGYVGMKNNVKRGEYINKLMDLGVINNKHIPDIYMRASVEQRQALLQGLMDSDGYITKLGQAQFTNTNKVLIDQVNELVCSLGMKTFSGDGYIPQQLPGCEPNKNVEFYPFSDQRVFRLDRKFSRQKKYTSCSVRSTVRYITGCKEIPSVPVRCIQVDDYRGMFLAGKNMVPTHNSAFSSAVALYLLAADSEPGAQVISAATTHNQAKVIWDVSKQLAEHPDTRWLLQDKLNIETMAKSIFVRKSFSRFAALSKDGKRFDGKNLHAAFMDEAHAYDNDILWNVILTGLGKRKQSIMWAITTAGPNLTGIGYEEHKYIVSVLLNEFEDDSYFGIIWAADEAYKEIDESGVETNYEADDCYTEATWEKCNPNWHVSIDKDMIRSVARQAVTLTSKRNNFLTKHCNRWCRDSFGLFDTTQLNAPPIFNKGLDLLKFKNKRCYMGIDLGSVSDITALVLLFPEIKKVVDPDGLERSDLYISLFMRAYITKNASRNSSVQGYKKWVEDGQLIETHGDVTDYNVLKRDLLEDYKLFDIRVIGYDNYNAAQLVTELTNMGLPMQMVGQGFKYLSPATKELQRLIADKRIEHNNTLWSWMCGNAVALQDNHNNIKPIKENPKSHLKIDGLAAALDALVLLMDNEFDGDVKFIY